MAQASTQPDDWVMVDGAVEDVDEDEDWEGARLSILKDAARVAGGDVAAAAGGEDGEGGDDPEMASMLSQVAQGSTTMSALTGTLSQIKDLVRQAGVAKATRFMLEHDPSVPGPATDQYNRLASVYALPDTSNLHGAVKEMLSSGYIKNMHMSADGTLVMDTD